MKNSLFYTKIYQNTKHLPNEWDTIALPNIFLSKEYLKVLEIAAPKNMQCFFIGVFQENKLVGVAISQFINLNQLDPFGEKENSVKTTVRNFIFRNFCSQVLFIGNNMLTGENGFVYTNAIAIEQMVIQLEKASQDIQVLLQKKKIKIHITVFKDFETKNAQKISPVLPDYFLFSTQPNMVFWIEEKWKTEADYVANFTKKYRDQYKRARKKASAIEKRKLEVAEIIRHQDKINTLYHTVAFNAPFNTFFVPENHFVTLKENLKDNFLFYGYFIANQMVGFNTLIKNDGVMETYFLGYDATFQKETMLYLNMLLDMIAYSIKKGFSAIVFGRTALEIKSSVGAKPVEVFGFIKHHVLPVNKCIGYIFNYLEPKTSWQQRHPFGE